MKKVILLGDSIRMQYQEPVGKKLADIANAVMCMMFINKTVLNKRSI
ncbi:MAG: hypothetical protein K5886_11325 [Lachnospiraceae bacterium]|nr:hypothetical protein [Lachnospiraceae bacterium]